MNKVWDLPRTAWQRTANSVGMARYSNRVDAVLASYPKSGRTWFRFILSSYLANAYGLQPAPDLYSMFAVMPNFDMDTQRGLPAFAFAAHKSAPPLIAVSHLPYSRLRFRNHPIIFMVRDPRDVMVSKYFHATRHKHRFSGDIDGFLRDPKHGIASLAEYLNGWSAGLQGRKHVVVSYEDLSRDTLGETARVLALLDLEIKPRMLADAVEAARFQNMQALELTKGLPGHDYDRRDGESRRMRRGKAGGFADYLTPEQIRFVETTCDRALTPEARALLTRSMI
ncbi:sulfotransferase domain-containing protein [Paracoccus benzoatiresistens]|uniref:Sulfotransferase domain-containing protein n=1 Tax=Paracoccus benzoatiresistens TaxID=2997341 RepID=A0ABT4JC81_9RHOB|nr:sulfotransferase domain-containing protein [Paracoccus sp. EF6]MCZ0963953.1 sulfotransferase domain-containing protein [Paracoccus sp. EF6]